jgi:hypothetical protein
MPDEPLEVIPYDFTHERTLRHEMQEAPPYNPLSQLVNGEHYVEGCYITPMIEGAE